MKIIEMRKIADKNSFQAANKKKFLLLNEELKNFLCNAIDKEKEKFFNGCYAIDEEGRIFQYIAKKEYDYNIIKIDGCLVYSNKFYVCNYAEDGKLF